MTISNARLTPALDHYLIAVSKLVDDDHVVRMEHDGATVTKDGQTVLQVPCINGLYQYNEPERSLMSYNVPYSSTPISNSHQLELLHLDICEHTNT